MSPDDQMSSRSALSILSKHLVIDLNQVRPIGFLGLNGAQEMGVKLWLASSDKRPGVV